MREASDLPIVAQMTFAEDLRTPLGYSPEQVADTLGALEVDATGANCSVGSNTLLDVTRRLVQAGAPRVTAMPNAGWPTREGNRLIYLSSPEYMADMARQMVDAGACLVGGCCGTTPAHIRVLRETLARPAASAVEVIRTQELDTETGETTGVSQLASRLAARRRVTSVEVRPPRGANPSKALQGARLLKEAGVDAVNVVDSAMSRVRMSAIASAVLIERQVGIETILHFTTRDRNLMAIQSDLIGAHAMGVRNVLALTGDPPTMGDYADAKAVYDVDSIGLIRIIKQFNSGTDIGGNSVGTPTQFLVGCALNPTAEDLGLEIERFGRKVEAGADFVMTQPVFDADLFGRVLAEAGPIPIPVIMGILPLQSYRHALFLHNELPGVKLTEEVLDRMQRAGPDGISEGLLIAHEMIRECGEKTAGLYIVPSFGRYEAAAQLVAALSLPV